MRGSKERAKPATFTRSGTGLGAAGWNRDRVKETEKKATRMVRAREAHDLVTAWNFDRTKRIADSMGSVRCWTSARTAKRMSIGRRCWY